MISIITTAFLLIFVSNWMLLTVSAFGSLPTYHGQHISTSANSAFSASYSSSYYASPVSLSTSASLSVSTTQLSASKNTMKKGVPRVAVRPRPLVKFDESGLYIPEDKSAGRFDIVPDNDENNIGMSTRMNTNMPSWNAFKDGVSNFVDFITRADSRNTIENTIKNRKMAIAYSDTVEAHMGKKNGNKAVAIVPSPTTSIAAQDSAETLGKNVLNQYQASLKNTDFSNGENLYFSPLRNSFDAGKDIFYGTIDSLTSTSNNINVDTEKRALYPDTREESKVAARPSVNRDEDVAIVAEYASSLTSVNPIKRLKANLAIAADTQRRKRRLEQERRAETVNSIRQILFTFVDSIQILYKVLVNVPSEIEKSIEMTQYEIEKAAVKIQKSPEKVQLMIEDTKKTAKETQTATVKIVNEAQQMPKRVGDTVAGTVKEVRAIPTKVNKSIEDTKNEVKYFVQEARYRTGLEIRPRPPPPPPKAKSLEELRNELALKVAKEAALFAGKASIVIATGTAGMAVGGVKIALQAAKAAQEKSKRERKDSEMVRESQLATPIPTAPIVTPLSIAEIDPSLEKEVLEALRLVEVAMKESKVTEISKPEVEVAMKESKVTEISKPEVKIETTRKVLRKSRPLAISPNDIDINEAVNRANLAAENAQKDAAFLKAFLNKRKMSKK